MQQQSVIQSQVNQSQVNQSQVSQQQQQQQLNQVDDINQDLDDLFESLKIERQGPQSDQIEKSTLLALLLYLNLDQTEPQFFNYLARQLNEHQEDTLSKEYFKSLFLDPKINTEDLKGEELAQVFSIFDLQKKGSFGAEDFIKMYSQTGEYIQMSQSQRQQIEARIKKDFEIISQEHKEITPIEFFKIINNQN